MHYSLSLLDYKTTGYFTELVTDYLEAKDTIRPFYEHPVSLEGIVAAIHSREKFSTNRELLVHALTSQYSRVEEVQQVKENIEKLNASNCFTICTAHQPNIFTGYLYFIYKILHVIKLADTLKTQLPQYEFVPVYYMGSEDADLEELGKVFLNGEKLVWNTTQTGAVGRMNTKGIERLINRIEGELSVLPFGNELCQILKEAYLGSEDIQAATFKLVHRLFASFGLVVLIADTPLLKRQMVEVFKEDILTHTPSKIVASTIERLAEKYKVQAKPRDINLFYLKDDIRNRIERRGDDFVVVDTSIRFTLEELFNELKNHPDRFSPNVILRGLYQETILPNIAFVGGGGELAYWFELKDLFRHYHVPYPVQVLRNSFLLIDEKVANKIKSLDFEEVDFFQAPSTLLNELVKRETSTQVHLNNEIRDTKAFYEHLRKITAQIDQTLVTNVSALETKMLKQLVSLEKKMLRAEKRKFSDQSRQIEKLRNILFPNNNLQERVENFMPYYARWGAEFFRCIYESSPALDQKFILLKHQTHSVVRSL